LFYDTYTIDINVTDNGGQAMGEELRHVQMSTLSRWSKWTLRVVR